MSSPSSPLCFSWNMASVFLAIPIVVLQLLSFPQTATSEPNSSKKAPNIVFILADDLGWNDIGFNNPEIISPHIDGLARSGVILNQSYVQPLCSPSRAALMTGVYPFRLGMQHYAILNDQATCVPRDRLFLSDVLKAAGYATHIVGKWHLGFCNKDCTPTYRGFDSFYGFYTAMEDYYNKTTDGGFDFRDNEKVERSGAGNYSTYQYRERIRKIIDDFDTNKPLFMYLSFQNVHQPLEVPEKYSDLYPDVQDKKRKIHNGMVTDLDDAVGDLVTSLKTKGLYDNTLIVFSVDNGGMVPFAGSNYPLRGSKLSIFEGGTRAAAFVHGPMFNETGVKYDGLMHIVDWFPTLAEAAGATYNATDQDGVSQWKSLLDFTMPSKREEVVYNIDDSVSPVQGKAAIRIGDYKLIDGFPGLFPDWYEPSQYHDRWGNVVDRVEQADAVQIPESMRSLENYKALFNLKDDPNEHINLYDKHPDIVKRLESSLQEHRKRSIPANFPLPDPSSDPNHYEGAWSPGWC